MGARPDARAIAERVARGKLAASSTAKPANSETALPDTARKALAEKVAKSRLERRSAVPQLTDAVRAALEKLQELPAGQPLFPASQRLACTSFFPK